MKIEKIMQQLREKTAADASATTPATPPAAAPAASTAPVAPAPTGPVADVTKMASELAGMEKDAAVKEAYDLGRAFADGVAARWSELEHAGNALPQVEKIASSVARAPVTPEMMKAAEEAAYVAQSQQLDKEAQDAFQAGWIEGLKEAHQGAMIEFIKGAGVTGQLIDAAVAQRDQAAK